MIDHALAYAERGWSVFPLHNIESTGTCSCGTRCQTRGYKPGKHPRTRHGFKDATTDHDQIREWWTKWPNANIGIATGPASGIWVLDVDTERSVDIGGGLLVPEGKHSLDILIDEHDEIPETLASITGSGGTHYLFAYRDGIDLGNRAGVRPSIDVRGAGGYIVAPPSNHVAGGKYRWIDETASVLPAPDWLVDVALNRSKDGVQTESAWSASDFLQGRKIRVGERNDTLFRLGAFYRGVHGFEFPQIHALLMGHNVNDTEEPLPAETIIDLAERAATYPVNQPENELTLPSGAIRDTGAEDVVIDDGADLAISLGDFMAIEMEPPVPIVDGLIDGGVGIILAGQPGIGKSWITLDMAVSVATGTEFLGHFPTRQGSVLIIDEEGTEWGDQRRFDMLLEGRGIGSANGVPIYLAIGRGYKLDSPKGLAAIRRMIERYRPSLVIIDSLVRVHSGDENVSKDMSAFFEISTRLMKSTGAAFLFVHHVRKIGVLDHGTDPGEFMRGSSEIRAWPSIGFVALPGSGNIQFYNIKQRWREEHKPFEIRLAVDKEAQTAKLGYLGEIEPKNQSAAQTGSRIMNIIIDLDQQGIDPTAIKVASVLNKSTNTVLDHLNRMTAAGLLTKEPARNPEEGRKGTPPMAFYPVTPKTPESVEGSAQGALWTVT